MRVRIHLNLAKPDQAENAVRVLTGKGTWSTVAYATELVLENCIPVVNPQSQEKIEHGKSRKVPHAFIEGDLVHFKGRLRKLATEKAKKQAEGRLVEDPAFSSLARNAAQMGQAVNYNPRFAKCFYMDKPSRDEVDSRFISCSSMVVVGWKFWAIDPLVSMMLAEDFCQPQALLLASTSEKSVLRRGHEQTINRLTELTNTTARTPRA